MEKVQFVPKKVRIVLNGLLSFVNVLYNILYFFLKKGKKFNKNKTAGLEETL